MLRLGLLLCALTAQLQGLEILDPQEVEYIHLEASGAAGGSVTLECGTTLPTIYIWAYTGVATDNSVALAYNYGQGTKLQPRASPSSSASHSHSYTHISVPLNSSALVLEGLRVEAAGTYTCQALYDTEGGARVTFYITRLDMEGEEEEVVEEKEVEQVE